MKSILTLMLSALMFGAAQGQGSPDQKQPQGMGGGGFVIGFGQQDYSPLKVFAPSDVGTLPKEHLTIGGMGYGMIDRLVLGGSGFGVLSPDVVTDSVQFSVGGGMGMFNFGYLVVDKPKIKVFPLLGIGGGGVNVRIAKNHNVSAKEVAANPGHEININNGGFILDASVVMNFIPFMEYDEKSRSYGGFMMGLRVGYAYGVRDGNWQFTGGDVTGGPSFRVNMPYIQLILGGFGKEVAGEK